MLVLSDEVYNLFCHEPMSTFLNEFEFSWKQYLGNEAQDVESEVKMTKIQYLFKCFNLSNLWKRDKTIMV